MTHATLRLAGLIVLVTALLGGSCWGQEILLDKSVKAGELILFQDFHDAKTYYYVPDKARLGVGEDGKPQFSFLKFVTNVPGKPGEEEAEEGEGGGIVHCLVQLGASEDQITEARTELRRQVPGATIAGPIIFRSGKFGIVSSFKQEDGDWTTKVLGLGSAPILDGEKAAVSIRLTKLGAKILWQSFKTATPDISFTFEMEMAGYRNPYEASLEADWEQVYSHRDFSLGFASTYLGFQIRDTLDDLKNRGAIKLVQKGEDAKLDTLVAMAYGKICDAMFDKIQTGESGSGQRDMLDRASDYLKTQREQSRRTSRLIPGIWHDWTATPTALRHPKLMGGGADVSPRWETSVEQIGESPRIMSLPLSVPWQGKTSEERPTSSTENPPAEGEGKEPDSEAKSQPSSSTTDESTSTEKQPAPSAAEQQTSTGPTAPSEPGTATQPGEVSAPEGESAPPRTFKPHESQSLEGRTPATEAAEERPSGTSATSAAAQRTPSGKSEPSFALLASYTMKTIRRTGKFELSFKKYSSDTLQLRFDENIGNLSRLMNDRKHFFEVNLDDPVFKQREISVYLDGQNATDFANYVNYVTVRLRKVHESGAQTNDEVRIDRANFNQNGNYFRLLYGWKDDKNRDKWMSYEYNTVWSFHGGKEVDAGWKKGNTFALTVAPPYLKRTIHLEADPTAIQDANVRLITVKFFYDVAGSEQMKQATLNPASGQLSQTLEYVRPADQLGYDYEITWRLRGGQTVTSGRKTSTDDFIFCDELPAQRIALADGGTR